MEELFQYMKTFRSQINDMADQAAKISVEEHMQGTTIQTLQKDLNSVNNKTRNVVEETGQIKKESAQICMQISEQQRTIASLESDSSTLGQTMELMRQEVLNLSGKLLDQREHYMKIDEDISGQLKQHLEWVNAQNFGSETREGLVNKRANGTKVSQISNNKAFATTEYGNDLSQREILDFQAAQVKHDKIEQLRSDLVSENNKLRRSLEVVKTKMTEFKPELRDMDEKSLEEELQALLSDKAGETEYLETMQLQIMRLKEISHTVKCSCGEEYIVKLDV